MKKEITERIAYFTKKVAEKGAVHPARVQPRSFTYRYQRLMVYKAMMHKHKEIEKQRA